MRSPRTRAVESLVSSTIQAPNLHILGAFPHAGTHLGRHQVTANLVSPLRGTPRTVEKGAVRPPERASRLAPKQDWPVVQQTIGEGVEGAADEGKGGEGALAVEGRSRRITRDEVCVRKGQLSLES